MSSLAFLRPRASARKLKQRRMANFARTASKYLKGRHVLKPERPSTMPRV
jgi:hypothetical protein